MWDFLEQIRTIRKMGPLKDLLEKLPFFADSLPEGVNIDDKALTRIEAMIQSMTAQERDKPELIEKQPRRALRIGKGSGIPAQEIVELVQRSRRCARSWGRSARRGAVAC
jgi:signal recognition particle subunit SRP54